MSIIKIIKKYVVSSILVVVFVFYVIVQRTNDAIVQKQSEIIPQQNIVADAIPVLDNPTILVPVDKTTTPTPVSSVPTASVSSQIRKFVNSFEDEEDDDGVFVPKQAIKPIIKPAVTTAPIKTISTPAVTSTATSVPVVKQTGMYKNGTYNGSVVFVKDGNLQTQAIIKNGKIVDIKFLILPNGSWRSTEISNFALPILRTEAITAQSANVNAVSEATLTSPAFSESLGVALALAKN